MCFSSENQATRYASQHSSAPVPSYDKLGELWQKGHSSYKLGNDGGSTNSPDGVASTRIVGASASFIFPCTIKSRRWQIIMEEVDKGCSTFCITVGTVTRIAGILIHSRLKVLAQSTINRISSCAMDFVVCANLYSSSWV